MTQHTSSQPSGFFGLGIAPKLLDILGKKGFATPTPIQQKAIPIALQAQDLIGIAQTGTGKTLAFGIPMIQRLAQTRGRGLVLLPTRELALQVEEAIAAIGVGIGVKTAVLIGGAPMGKQIQQLRRNPHIIMATPGRLIDHLEQKTLNLNDVNVLVLDEADRMLDMGFQPQLKKILAAVPRERQTLLFSATMPQEIVRLANQYMKLPMRVEIARAGTTANRITQELYFVHKEAKSRLLQKLLNDFHGTILVFSRTKHGAKNLAHILKAKGHAVAEIHSNRSLGQRRDALEGFKTGRYRVLVATDIAARGIDVTGIELVINFDLPDNPDDYVHRIGRTGRAGLPGHAISFATPDQRGDIRQIERLIRATLKVTPVPQLPPPDPYTPQQHSQSQPPRRFGGGGQRPRRPGFSNSRPQHRRR